MLNNTCHTCSQPATVWVYLNDDPVAYCAIHNPYDFGGGVHAAQQRIAAVEAELAALRAWKASAVPLLRALADVCQYTLRGDPSVLRCHYPLCSPWRKLGETTWRHSEACPVAQTRALLVESEVHHGE